MGPNMRCVAVVLAVLAAVAPATAFYLPGVAPQDYARVRPASRHRIPAFPRAPLST
jgi:hypothetical protein